MRNRDAQILDHIADGKKYAKIVSLMGLSSRGVVAGVVRRHRQRQLTVPVPKIVERLTNWS